MSAVLEAAIQNQLTNRTKRNSEGKLLCRRCLRVIPPDYSVVFWDPADESKVWGPCCSDECICHLKICSECNHDFIIDQEGEITHIGEGVWLCKDCIKKVEICPCCNRKSPLVDSPAGKICKSCFDKKFFICKDCGKLKDRDNNPVSLTEIAQWSHVIGEDEFNKICSDCYTARKKGKEPLPVASCKYCREVFPIDGNVVSHEYCPRCISCGYVRKCTRCGIYTGQYDKVGSYYYCRGCSSKIVLCSCCNKGFFKGEGFKIKGQVMICKECNKSKKEIKECPSCLSVSLKPLIKVKGKKDACEKCYNYYGFCEECGQYHFQEGHCRKNQVRIMDYSYKPFTHFNGSPSSRVFFGFENEINYIEEFYNTAKNTILRSYPSEVLYAKRDGSISGHGFELVSHPMSLDFFNELDLEPMFRVKPKERDTSCGLHVHVSRTSFDGQAHLFKLTEFINDNKTFTKKIAGRNFNSYARDYQEKISAAIKGTGCCERYHAVNLTNKKTVEIRIFKSARNEYQLRYRIEFVNAIVEYTRSASFKFLKDVDFKRWLTTQPGYGTLKKFLKI